MEKLIRKINELKKTGISNLIGRRLKEFESTGRKKTDWLFSEMCFCMLTANFSAERGMHIQQKLGDKVCTLPERKIADELKKSGHRFPNTRARYISAASKKREMIFKALDSIRDEKEKREWIVRNVKGLGYKEASHFLRNIGYKNLAIIDFHIVDVLADHGIAKRPKTMTKARYLEIEGKLQELGKKTGMNMAELDLYLWYLETGKVLK
ncbi:N-glycosylase/DNA lyase [Candidatus Woesearchaeota archaeon]|nr:N-glycosylase/DNA lyase [Candidatus Woesearchaeota archaeon]